MITFLLSILALIAGYFVYGKYVSKLFGVDKSRTTPAVAHPDGIDFVVLPPWKEFVIQFLNIAGLGPIFGAVLGAAYGPVAYIWIVFGCIFMGAAHDYFSGMLSLRNDGASIPEIVGKYLGRRAALFLRAFTMILLICVGVSFVKGPAELLAQLTGGGIYLWIIGIFVYYLLATLLPIDKIIGRIYPFFGAALLAMAVMIGGSMIILGATGDLAMQELSISSFTNMHANPESNILFPMLFIVISCGAISGFHSTQSPLIARTMANESEGRPIFYGSMIAEGIVAIIWATAAMNFFGGAEGLNVQAGLGLTPAKIVNEICNTWLGQFGAILAIIGVVACPITSGDTAFRSSRLLVADVLKVEQKSIAKRLMICAPIFALAIFMTEVNFSTIWNYVGISNQVLATVMLWTIAVYLKNEKKNHFVMSIPAALMTYVCVSYFLIAPNKVGGLALSGNIAYSVAGVAMVISIILFLRKKN
ncbi:MAG: carbon starvation CstA family protein [Candidatus Kapabacteria bacterium]|nr:carbon starvation CstA family protein [Candidatus Kapabacteria bacterium]